MGRNDRLSRYQVKGDGGREIFERSLKDLWKICEDLGDRIPSRKWINRR